MRKTLTALVVVVVVSGTCLAGETGTRQMGSLRMPGEFDRAAFEAEQARQVAALVSLQVEAGLANPLRVELTAAELAVIESGRCDGCEAVPETRALLAGMVKPVALSFDLAAPSHGAVARTADGLVWTAAVVSDSAAALRLHFTNFTLPPGFELWLYSTDGVARGPYTGRGPTGSGDFWAHTVAGPRTILQVRGRGAEAAESPASFTVAEVGQVGSAAALKEFCDDNAGCVVNGECYNDPAVADAKLAIAHMQYIKRPYIYFCSGGLLASSAYHGTPFFLTANHCISRDREAATLEAFFQFTIPCNSTECPSYNNINAESTIGASLVATNKTSDFTLLQLAEAPPPGSVFLGWSTAPMVGSGARMYRISHPQAAPQAYSEHEEWDPGWECTSWPIGPWIYSQDKVGATEGGSSGSPVVNGAGQVVGQLSGACGSNLNDNCDSVSNATVDGAFAAYYGQVAPWLGSGAGCTDADDDGYCTPEDCNDANPAVNPGAAEVCTDGIDNDCDGFTDGDDSDCTAACFPAGAACSSNAECCSGLCHPRKLTCK